MYNFRICVQLKQKWHEFEIQHNAMISFVAYNYLIPLHFCWEEPTQNETKLTHEGSACAIQWTHTLCGQLVSNLCHVLEQAASSLLFPGTHSMPLESKTWSDIYMVNVHSTYNWTYLQQIEIRIKYAVKLIFIQLLLTLAELFGWLLVLFPY